MYINNYDLVFFLFSMLHVSVTIFLSLFVCSAIANNITVQLLSCLDGSPINGSTVAFNSYLSQEKYFAISNGQGLTTLFVPDLQYNAGGYLSFIGPNGYTERTSVTFFPSKSNVTTKNFLTFPKR